MQREVTPWHPWEAIPVAVAALAATAIVGTIIAAAFGGTGGIFRIVGALVLQGAFLVFSFVWIGVRYRQGATALGLRSERGAKDVAVGAWSGVGLFAAVVFGLLPIAIFVWRAVTGGPPEAIDQQILPTAPGAVELVLALFAVVVAAPLGEEVFFRGFLFGSLRGRLGFWGAAAISGVVFAVFHLDPLLMILMFFVGVGLAALYEWRRSLVASIAAHAAFNVIGYTLLVMERMAS